MTLVLIGKGLVFGGMTFKNRGHWGSRYIYIYIVQLIDKFTVLMISMVLLHFQIRNS